MQALKKLDDKQKLLDKRKKSCSPGQSQKVNDEPSFEELALMEGENLADIAKESYLNANR